MGPDKHYTSQRRRIGELVRGLTPQQLGSRTVGCPEWSVHEVLAHLTGLSADVRTGRMEGAGSPAWTAVQVTERKGKDVDALLAEWEANAAAVEQSMVDSGSWIFVWDATMHEDDMREALGLPLGDSDTHGNVLNGLVRRAGQKIGEAGLPAVEIRAGAQSWTAGEGAPAASVTVADEGELGRVLGGRRTHDQIRALAWTGDPEPYLPHLTLFTPGG
ncbi:MAG: hypothetical protein JWP11_2177 [Frankiales bacterium]|nr:hypothetical protein [Frankiales bacterium]